MIAYTLVTNVLISTCRNMYKHNKGLQRNYTIMTNKDFKINWWKGKPSGSIACTRKQKLRFYWSCSSIVMNDATPLTPLAPRMSGTPFSNVNNIHVHSMIPEDQKNITTQWCSTGRLLTAATQALNPSCSNINSTDERESPQEALQQPRFY